MRVELRVATGFLAKVTRQRTQQRNKFEGQEKFRFMMTFVVSVGNIQVEIFQLIIKFVEEVAVKTQSFLV